MSNKQKTIFSGMQATGALHIGNYLGALKNWVELGAQYDCFYSVVDLHSITIRQEPEALRKRAREVLMLYMAAGLDAEKSCLYYQSHVSAHAELAWILNCFCYMGELNRMHQFKDKSAKNAANINAGLYTYPVLQAADILLYQADGVPVGIDQVQHLELSRDIAQRFNAIYGDVFTVPAPLLMKYGAKVMSLSDPTKKMSKSDENINGCIFILDERDTIIKKCKRAVTDSLAQVKYDGENQPGIANLIDIYRACTGKTVEEIENAFAGKGYGDFKLALGETIADTLGPIQERFYALSADRAYVDDIIQKNAEKAAQVANETLNNVKNKVGFP